MAPTILDIAKKARVNDSTVSRILNDNPKYQYSVDTVAKVKKAAEELGYQPNHFARSLKTGKTNIIGVSCGPAVQVRMMFTHAYFAGVFRGIGDVLTGHDHKLIFHNIGELQNNSASVEMAQTRLVDGMIYIVLSGDMDTFRLEHLPRLQELNIPFVVIHSLPAGYYGFPNVGLDCNGVAALAVDHLLEHGYPSVGMVVVNKYDRWHSLMLEGYKQALEEADLIYNETIVYESGSIELKDGYDLAGHLVKEGKELPRSLFVTEDRTARGMIKRFREEGVRVPEDIAIISFGDYFIFGGEFYNELTSVRQPDTKKGQKAAEMLFEMMDKPELMQKPKNVILEPELTKRTTCGC